MILRHLSVLAVLALGGALPAVAAQLECDAARSRIDVVVSATVDSFTGRLERYEPQITVGPDGRITAARVGFHFLDVHTGKDKRDRAMHEWQQTKQFPDGEFVLDALTPGAGGVWAARGRLTLHGRTQALEFPVTITTQDDVCAIDGDAVVDTREFDLPIIRLMGLLKVDPLVHVRFHLQGRRSQA